MNLSKLPTRERATSEPEDGKDYQCMLKQKQKSSAFPKLYDLSGYLDIRTRSTKSWKRKYFVLANNFLLMASTPFSSKLEKVIPLEGSNVKTTTKTSDLCFEILIRKKRNQFRAANESECNSWTERIQRASRLKIKDIYRFDAILGSNASGSTKVLSAKHRVTGEDVAVKVISKKEYNPKMLSNEVLILKRLDHPHVVKLFDLFETRKNVYLVMEKCNGGELFEQIANIRGGGGFTEKECITVLHQIAKAVKYMHSMGIVHRDLKPENILCVHPNSVKHVKIADFGISKVIFDPEIRKKEKEQLRKQKKERQKQLKTLQQRAMEMHNKNSEDYKENSNHFYKKSKKKKVIIDPLAKKKNHFYKKHRMSSTFRAKHDTMSTMCGTISYTAPEILKQRPYDKRVDYWSLGVIAFILLCGYPPFWGDTEVEVASSILKTKVILDEDDWSHVSDNGKELVLGLLEKKPSKRLGIDDILKHSWIYASKSVNKKAQKSFVQTVAKRKLRRMSMGVFETNSKKMDYIYRHHRNQNNDDYNSNSDAATSPISQLERQNSDSSVSTSYNMANRESISVSCSFRRFSRTDDDLFELRLPFDNDPDDDYMFQRRQSRSIKRKYSQ